MSPTSPLTIAVIGAGPSGLFFCHALEYIMQQTGRTIAVTCFERSSEAGGVWRAANPNGSINCHHTTEMYDNLWTNGASHCTEFFDYTYDEHFGSEQAPSVYMRRKDLLGYLKGRVQKQTPDFFEKYVRFNTNVKHVVYDDSNQHFTITLEDLSTSLTEVQYFDKCVWACGENGKQLLPESLVRIFRDGGFQGRLIHSSDTAQLEQDVKGKRILLIGGGFSSEDLALQAIKLGVEKVYVSCRDKTAEICWTTNWPMKKVKVLECQVPTRVTENGNCIQFHEVEWTHNGYEIYTEEVEEEIRGIHTVIFCTGYEVNLDMLDESIRKYGFPTSDFSVDEYVHVPPEWKMRQNVLTKLTGDVEPCDKIKYETGYVHPNFYKGVLIRNPNMMFISPYSSYVPLLACDAYAWLLAGYATGWLEMPTQEEMKARNDEEALMMLDVPYFRYLMDVNYCKTVNNLENFWREDGEYPEEWSQVTYEEWLLSLKRLAQIMLDGKYPFSLGNYQKLNKNGKTFLKFGDMDYKHRTSVAPSEWKTFRDVDDADQFYSLHTGTKATPLERPWLDMDKDTSD